MYGIIIKDDERYNYTEKYLLDKGITIKNTIEEKSPNFIIFPFKAQINPIYYNDDYFSRLNKNTIIFSGIENNYISLMCLDNNLKYYPLMNSDYVATLNAIPTSEGVICYLIENRRKILMGAKILIIGYGKCGSAIAKRLIALGVNVHALTRTADTYAKIISDGINPVYHNDAFEHEYDVIINTVPNHVIDDELLKRIPDKTLMIDIASKPFGFNIELAKKKNEKSNRLPSIPSKYALQTAGEILGKFIYEKVMSCSKAKK